MEKKKLIPSLIDNTSISLPKRGGKYKSLKERENEAAREKEEALARSLERARNRARECNCNCNCDNCDDHPFFAGESC